MEQLKPEGSPDHIFDNRQIANAAISASITPIVFVDSQFTILYANRAFLSIWGYSSLDEVIGKNGSIFWDVQGMNGKICRKIQDKGGWIGELNAYRQDGTVFPTQVSTTMLSGNDGTAVCQMISFIDISERINAQNEQQRLLADLQERVKELKCLYSIVSVQHSGESTLEGILRHIVASIPDSLRWPSCAYSRIVTGNIDICTPNFKRHCPLFTVPLNAGNETGFLEVGYYESGCPEENEKHLLEEEKDLLFAAAKEIERLIEYKLNEEELARNRARLLQADKISSIGVLSAEIIHEIGNPNNFIALNAKMLHQAWSNIKPILDTYYENNGDFSVAGLPFSEARQEISRLLDGIAEGSERIRKISSLLQTFISKKRPNQDETFRINDAVKKAVEFSKSYIDSCTEHFEMSLTPENPLVRGDAGQIQQVVINFVTNACQALTSRKDHIRIATLLDFDSRSVLIRVEDEGIGIDSREIQRVMDPFFSTKRDRNCSGLGLSISNDIALSHGGSIKLDSTPGSGTTAILVLPCTGSGDTFYK